MSVVFIGAAFIAGYCCWHILEANARREVLAEAGLMVDSALATRACTANEIPPLREQRVQESFPPRSIAFYAATQNVMKLRERHPEYAYKEATLNPTNPRARAADWAAEIIDAISAARTTVLVFCASSNESPQVRRKVERAVHKQGDILPFRIEEVPP